MLFSIHATIQIPEAPALQIIDHRADRHVLCGIQNYPF